MPHHEFTLQLDVEPVELTPQAIEASDRGRLVIALGQLGTDVNELGSEAMDADQGYDIVPLRQGWLRLGAGADGRLEACWISDPRDPQSVVGRPFLLQEADLDLNGLSLYRVDLDDTAEHWLNVFRQQHREAYVAVGYRRGDPEPERQGAVAGLYPDAVVAGSRGDRVVYVQPDPDHPGRTQLVVASLVADSDPVVVGAGDAAELTLAPTARRRWVKVEHGSRRSRRTFLVDTDGEPPVVVPIDRDDQPSDLVDVGVVEGQDVVFLLTRGEGRWALWCGVLDPVPDRLDRGHFDEVSTGSGEPFALSAGLQDVLVAVRTQDDDGGVEDLVLGVELPGGGTAPVRRSPGLLRLQGNSAISTVGFSIAERVGARGRVWFHAPDGTPIGEPDLDQDTSRLQRGWATVIAPDGQPVRVDARWHGEPGVFRGRVLLMLYGAYGLDLDLDGDPQLLQWMERGWAVATAAVRGGAGDRHHQATGELRENALVDAEAVVRWLRSANGVVEADPLVVLGASAGGLQAAVMAARCPDCVDAVIIVNGYVDPLGELMDPAAATAQSDRNEWGDPDDPRVREVLGRLSGAAPLATMAPAPAPGPQALVVACARDVRVDPRRAVAWFLRYRALGHPATLWYDPVGTHDRWGEHCPREAFVDWAGKALSLPCTPDCHADHSHVPAQKRPGPTS